MLNQYAVGLVLETNANGRLGAEGWFDIERLEHVDKRVLDSLTTGKNIELSTELFTKNEPAEQGATFNGKPYDFVARNYKPDHLAILPDQKGACSLDDGCGVLTNDDPDEEDTLMAKLTKARRSEMVNDLIDNCECWEENDREVLNAMTDGKLTKLSETSVRLRDQDKLIENASKEFTDPSGAKHVFNTEKKEWVTTPKKTDPKETEEPEKQVTNGTPEKKEEPEKKPLTNEEWLATAPAEWLENELGITIDEISNCSENNVEKYFEF
jgi:hypothetical protein